jgi:hypothetical protein
MSSRAARVTVVLLLVAVGAGVALFYWDAGRRIERVDDARANVDATLEGMMTATLEISRLQQDYVVSGGPDEHALMRVALLFDGLRSDARSLAVRAPAGGDHSRIKAVEDGIETLNGVDNRIREDISFYQLSAAADGAAGAARDAADDLHDRLARLRSAERTAADADSRRLLRQQAQALAGAAGVWLVGLLLLVPRPTPPVGATLPVAEPVSVASAPAPPPSVDLTQAATVCTAIAQVTDTDALPALLARAAAVLEAPGLVVWMGAGEELFAVAGYGYDQRLLGRLGPIRRQADNATAAAWRTGSTRLVAADTMSNGAIVAPMIGPGGCIGVLAAEVRGGRETDTAVQATTSIIAAQLATALAAWPQASVETASEARLHA